MATTRSSAHAVRDRARWPLAALLTCFLGVLPAPAAAITAFGLSNANQIVTFDTNTPSTPLSVVAITGLQSGETALGIDVRPATGQLYLLGSSSRIYVIDPVTGAATAVGAAFTPALSGTAFGFDFNPTVDRIRVVSDTGQNLRLNPDTGAVAAVDGALNPGAPHVVGSAYTNNFAGATTTTLYAIDFDDGSAAHPEPAERRHAGAGRSARRGHGRRRRLRHHRQRWRRLRHADDRRHDAAAHDQPGDGRGDAGRGGVRRDAARRRGPVAWRADGGAAQRHRAGALPQRHARDDPRHRHRHRAAAGGDARRHRHAPGRRPALWRRQHQPSLPVEPDHRRRDARSARSSRRCCPAPASAWTSTPWSIACASSATPSRTSASTRTTAPSPASTRRSIRRARSSAAAYLNNVDGTGSTVLYDIDAASDQLLIQNPPNGGVLTAVGSLGVNTSTDVAFDISPLDNTAFAALNVGGVAGLYTINLVTGAATPIGTIGTGTVVNGLTAMPLAYQFAEGATGTFFDTDLLLANPTASNVAVTVTYITEGGRVVTQGLTLAPQSRTTRVRRRQRAARRDGVLGHRDVAPGHPDRGRAHAALGRHRLRHAHGEDRPEPVADVVVRRRGAGLLPDLLPAHQSVADRERGDAALPASRTDRRSPGPTRWRRSRAAPSSPATSPSWSISRSGRW